ncbi:formate dehydrogenase, alpha subunit [Arcobacter nitrofigilis DSM 7299]|uniref:Formate dehydrogenase, alpha subunit n=1 Tax=Arcobacter nitrofigilis (strain ATCC 33309 / DSM 7299 / CCUG 15893 / LMG 7604 / NCTC 12251 / CI) TaxID=572480 RepID=D5V2H3_ARCNC|nr:formate dehydrogenase subunit alpha [Arcobacter nitrofigilis]ADG92406.1 formate dehydrogenase, alpha subunit [Arcobacter nitrofigilis DSM 7299]
MKETNVICPYCGTGCGIKLTSHDNKIVKIEGVKANPVNEGHLCLKGLYGWDYVESKDRLTKPLIRKKDGVFSKEGTFEESSWDEALSLVVSKMKEAKETYGPDSIVGNFSARCTLEENYLAQKFMRAIIGTNNVDHCARVCHAPTVAGLAKTIGNGTATNSFTEFEEHTNCIMMIGSNPENAHPIAAMYIQRAINRGAKLIVIDPIRTEFAQKADVFIQLPPEYNIPIINALINHIIAKDLYDKEFVEKYTHGFEYLKEAVKEYTPQKVSEMTGVDAKLLIKAAELYATVSPAAITHGMGVTHFNHGVGNVCDISNIMLITGNIGKLGAGDLPLRGQQNVQGACDMGVLPNIFPNLKLVSSAENKAFFEKLWDCKQPLSTEIGIHKTEVPDAIMDGRIKVFYTIGENPVMSEPNTNHFLKGISKLDFYVVQDIFMTETALKADVVFPAVSVGEKQGCYLNAERRVQLNDKTLDPKGEAKQDWEIICELAKRFGATDFDYEKPEDIWNEVRRADPVRFGGISYARLQGKEGIAWPCPSEDHPGTPSLYMDKKFFTKDTKANLVPVIFIDNKDNMVDAEDELRKKLNLPENYPCMIGSVDEKVDEIYPISLLTTRKVYQYTVGTMTRRSKVIEYGGDSHGPSAEIHPDLAKRYNLKNHDFIKVESRYGYIALLVEITEVVPDNIMQMAFHYWEGLCNELTSGGWDYTTKTPTYKAAVRMEKITQEEYSTIMSLKKMKFKTSKIIYDDYHHHE